MDPRRTAYPELATSSRPIGSFATLLTPADSSRPRRGQRGGHPVLPQRNHRRREHKDQTHQTPNVRPSRLPTTTTPNPTRLAHHRPSPPKVQQSRFPYRPLDPRLVWYNEITARSKARISKLGVFDNWHQCLVRDDYADWHQFGETAGWVPQCGDHLIRHLQGVLDLAPGGAAAGQSGAESGHKTPLNSSTPPPTRASTPKLWLTSGGVMTRVSLSESQPTCPDPDIKAIIMDPDPLVAPPLYTNLKKSAFLINPAASYPHGKVHRTSSEDSGSRSSNRTSGAS